jgi:hypothetical protein
LNFEPFHALHTTTKKDHDHAWARGLRFGGK